ncbi:DUF2515 family protein [Thalassobacillus hwangdonensis]|uniref:DUF2515 family protein n=1 Tax=Thalassobacillus hwangdonensis TaxID=546108 RepID=A0ABW3KX46_9BACI
MTDLTPYDLNLIAAQVNEYNRDNITRTKAYQNFYFEYPEIKWSLLAGIVSRNAGWNMTDLTTEPFISFLNEKMRNQLFMTYERANWLIFSDAFPQLLIYSLSKKKGIPLFDELKAFKVSSFMIQEWHRFFETGDEQRLTKALIINEQNMIQRPVIIQPYFHQQVFRHWPYLLESLLKLNVVLFPTVEGELYGLSINRFTSLDRRIAIGHSLTSLLFNPALYEQFTIFIQQVPVTGSRTEYEGYRKGHASPLRECYQIVTHEDQLREDWYKIRGIKQRWWDLSIPAESFAPQKFYFKKRLMLQLAKILPVNTKGMPPKG